MQTMWIFRASKLHPKKVSENNVDFSAREITTKKIHGKQQVFQTSKLGKKKYVEPTWTFRSAKLHQRSSWK